MLTSGIRAGVSLAVGMIIAFALMGFGRPAGPTSRAGTPLGPVNHAQLLAFVTANGSAEMPANRTARLIGSSGDIGEECNECINDCDDPPPNWENCEVFCYGPACGFCSFIPEEDGGCWEGDCFDLVGEYWEGGNWCGWACPNRTGVVVEECEPHLDLDGAAAEAVALLNGAEPGTGGVELVPTGENGMLIRGGCQDAVIGRLYDGAQLTRATAMLSTLQL